MKLVPGETSLVVAGAWNPAIVTPDWVIKFGLKKNPTEIGRVQALVPTGAGMVFDFPKFTFDGLTFMVRPDALVINPAETIAKNLEEIEFLASNTISELTHTPIAGLGHNFEFRDADPAPHFLKVFTSSQTDLVQAVPEGWITNGSAITSHLQYENTALNITRTFVANQLSVKFNFHHQVATGAQALEVLRGENGYKHISANFELARDLIRKMYGEIDED